MPSLIIKPFNETVRECGGEAAIKSGVVLSFSGTAFLASATRNGHFTLSAYAGERATGVLRVRSALAEQERAARRGCCASLAPAAPAAAPSLGSAFPFPSLLRHPLCASPSRLTCARQIACATSGAQKAAAELKPLTSEFLNAMRLSPRAALGPRCCAGQRGHARGCLAQRGCARLLLKAKHRGFLPEREWSGHTSSSPQSKARLTAALALLRGCVWR